MKSFSVQYLFILIAIAVMPLCAQTGKIDSLRTVAHNTEAQDTNRLNSLNIISIRYTDSKPDSAIVYSEQLIKLASEKREPKFEALGYHGKGRAYLRKGDIESAFKALAKTIQLSKSISNKNLLAYGYSGMSALFNMQKDTAKENEYNRMALDLFEKINSKRGIATVLLNMSSHPGPNNKSYLLRSLKLNREINNKAGIATALFKLAMEKVDERKTTIIPDEFFQSLKTYEELNNIVWISYINATIAEMYNQRGEWNKAIEYAMKGYKMAESNGLSKEKLNNLTNLIPALAKLNKFKDAYEFYNIYITERDSVNNLQVSNSILKQEAASVYDRQKAIDKKEEEKKLALADSEKQKQKILTYSIAIGLILVIVFAIIISGRLRLTKKQKNIIDEQNKSTEKQKEIIEAKQKEIIDSINYAKRLQEAILPTEEYIKMHLPESFVLFIPKDIVAGDFYWLESVSSLKVGADLVFVAAADCTGHGVPGAIVSMICHNALNRALLEYEITEPGKILNITRELVISTFERSDSTVKDGMDISLGCLNKKTNEFFWAGANNPIWIISANENAIKEFPPNKQPIGKVDNPQPFVTHKIQLHKGDVVYLFTDGFADQFGGPKGKKFKYKQLSDLLCEINPKALDEQKLILTEKFEDWRGALEQVDDVCLIGIKI